MREGDSYFPLLEPLKPFSQLFRYLEDAVTPLSVVLMPVNGSDAGLPRMYLSMAGEGL